MATDNAQVSDYIQGLDEGQRAICERLRALVGEIEGIEERFSWKRPIYRLGGAAFCYFVANKGWVSFGFDRGTDLDDPEGRLEGDGKTMRHLKIPDPDALDEAYCRALLASARSLVTG